MEKIKSFLKGFGKGFKKFGEGVSNVVNFVLLTFVYFIGIGITSLFAKIFGKKFLDMKEGEKSYWKNKEGEKELKDYKKMF
ncbi:MAG: hypothetical protein GF368_02025 [Candidatus Aenigmarchaeota archaeon]|nr:hypothetical protein [Candidatus Aenigmarchaeota archaeon]